MDLLVRDSTNPDMGEFRLRASRAGHVEQIVGQSEVVASWNRPEHEALFEVHSDGRSIRVGSKRFLVDASEDDEQVLEWFAVYSPSEVNEGLAFPQPETSSSESSNDRLSRLRDQGLLTDEEFRRLFEESQKGSRLEKLRSEGLLSDDEVKMLSGRGEIQPVQRSLVTTPTPVVSTTGFSQPSGTMIVLAVVYFVALLVHLWHLTGIWVNLGTDEYGNSYYLDLSRFGKAYSNMREAGTSSFDVRGEYARWGGWVFFAVAVIGACLVLYLVLSDRPVAEARSWAGLVALFLVAGAALDIATTLWARQPSSEEPTMMLDNVAWLGLPSLLVMLVILVAAIRSPRRSN